MTDSFTPVHLTIATEVETLAVASTEPTAEILLGEGLRRIVAERLSQVTEHGYTPERDLNNDGAELALASKAFLDTYIDLELRPDEAPTGVPDSWPFDNLYWKEPRPEDRTKALVKAIAVAWAELDRHLASQLLQATLRHNARPLHPLPDADLQGRAP